MTLREAREILELGLEASRQEIQTAYRRAARRWHPDRAPAGAEAEHRARMQAVNAAYQRVRQFLENYRFRLEETAPPPDDHEWWEERFSTGVWGYPPRRSAQERSEEP